MKTALTTEGLYRYTERLGIMCGDRDPTPFEHGIALREAQAWERAHGGKLNKMHWVHTPNSLIEKAE